MLYQSVLEENSVSFHYMQSKPTLSTSSPGHHLDLISRPISLSWGSCLISQSHPEKGTSIFLWCVIGALGQGSTSRLLLIGLLLLLIVSNSLIWKGPPGQLEHLEPAVFMCACWPTPFYEFNISQRRQAPTFCWDSYHTSDSYGLFSHTNILIVYISSIHNMLIYRSMRKSIMSI